MFDRARRTRACVLAVILLCLLLSEEGLSQKPSSADELNQRMKELVQEMIRTGAQLEDSQKQMIELKQGLTALQQQLTELNRPPQNSQPVDSQSQLNSLAEAVESLNEDHQVEETELAVHEQTKVESVSKYPIKVSGTILLNGFANSKQTSIPLTPTYFSSGSGSTGLSLSQTILGLQGTGPTLWGATSSARMPSL
jgi:hypothetical protein